MTLEDLKRKFIVDEDVLKTRLEALVEKALPFCVVGQNGFVHITAEGLSGKDRIKLALAARALASELMENTSAAISVSELSKMAGLPENQVRARCKDLVSERYADSPARGTFRALPHKLESFLNALRTPDSES